MKKMAVCGAAVPSTVIMDEGLSAYDRGREGILCKAGLGATGARASPAQFV